MVIALVIVVVALASFVGYVFWSMLSWISNVASFTETLQKDGFTIIHATDKPLRSFLWLPPAPTSINCQNQTQFIHEARSLNTTYIYQLDIFHFYAVTSDTMIAYEYTPPYPSSLDPLIGAVLSYLVP